MSRKKDKKSAKQTPPAAAVTTTTTTTPSDHTSSLNPSHPPSAPSSEAPTLPTISSDQQPSTKKRSSPAPSNPPAQKRPRLLPADPSALLRPWTLLPSPLHTSPLAERLSRTCTPVVIRKNENTRSCINKLRSVILGKESEGEGERGRVVAICAAGEATGKGVGVVEVLRRRAGGKEGEGWWVYVSLGSVEGRWEGDKEKGGEGREEESEEEEEAFERLDRDRGGRGREWVGRRRRVPVLTVWMSRVRIAEFRDAFGEERWGSVGA